MPPYSSLQSDAPQAQAARACRAVQEMRQSILVDVRKITTDILGAPQPQCPKRSTAVETELRNVERQAGPETIFPPKRDATSRSASIIDALIRTAGARLAAPGEAVLALPSSGWQHTLLPPLPEARAMPRAFRSPNAATSTTESGCAATTEISWTATSGATPLRN